MYYYLEDFILTLLHFFFWFDLFLHARAEIQKYFCSFLVLKKTLKSPFEIIWPLGYPISAKDFSIFKFP